MTYELPDPALPHSRMVTNKGVFGDLFTADQMQQAYQAGRDSLIIQNASLKLFALKILDGFPELGTFDGGDIQEMAVDCGLLIGNEVTEPCSEGCNCTEYEFLTPEGKFEYPVTCYHKTEFLK